MSSDIAFTMTSSDDDRVRHFDANGEEIFDEETLRDQNWTGRIREIPVIDVMHWGEVVARRMTCIFPAGDEVICMADDDDTEEMWIYRVSDGRYTSGDDEDEYIMPDDLKRVQAFASTVDAGGWWATDDALLRLAHGGPPRDYVLGTATRPLPDDAEGA